MDSFNQLISTIRARRHAVDPIRTTLIGLSGIDASGKGFIAARVATRLQMAGLNVALIGVDGWLNLPHIRFDDRTPARHFYEHALRLDELFERLVLPLQRNRSVSIEMDYAEEIASKFRRQRYDFVEVDVAIVKGIFLFKRRYVRHFDLTVWVECSFETALNRAIAREQKGSPLAETIRAFETIYFPAQRIHFEKDEPRRFADVTFQNDLEVRCLNSAFSIGNSSALTAGELPPR